jgi:VanZ family protein
MDLFINRFLKNRKEGLFLWLLVIFSLSLTPGNYIPKVGFSYTDLVVHFIFYAILSMLSFFSFYQKMSRVKAFQIFFASAFIGFVVELLQGILPIGRFFDWSDVLFNSIGASAVLFLFFVNKRL